MKELFLKNTKEEVEAFFRKEGVIRKRNEFSSDDISKLEGEISNIIRAEQSSIVEGVVGILERQGFDLNLIYGPQGEKVMLKFTA